MAKRKGKGSDVDRSIAAGNTGGRQVAGTGYAYSKVDNPSGREFGKGQLVRKANGGIGKPEGATAAHRPPVTQDRLGPRFAIQTKMPGPQAPEATLTQQNTKFVPSAINRSLPNFNYGRLG